MPIRSKPCPVASADRSPCIAPFRILLYVLGDSISGFDAFNTKGTRQCRFRETQNRRRGPGRSEKILGCFIVYVYCLIILGPKLTIIGLQDENGYN